MKIKIAATPGADISVIVDNLSNLSYNELRFIKSSKIKFVALVDNVTEFLPNLRGSLSFDKTRLFDDIPGLYHPRSKSLLMATKIPSGILPGWTMSGSQNTFLHELGHALDFALARKSTLRDTAGNRVQRASASAQFRTYYLDSQGSSGRPLTPGAEDYYDATHADAGMRIGEAFAESYAALKTTAPAFGGNGYQKSFPSPVPGAPPSFTSFIDSRPQFHIYFNSLTW